MDFFNSQYITESARNDLRFGLIDDGLLAQSTTDDEDRWLAIINNSQGKEIQFIPVDHNIKIFDGQNERSMCDGMLYDYEKNGLPLSK